MRCASLAVVLALCATCAAFQPPVLVPNSHFVVRGCAAGRVAGRVPGRVPGRQTESFRAVLTSSDSVPLAGGLEVSPLGVGAWAWGDKLFWGYDDNQETQACEAFNTAVDLGVTLFDTAEVPQHTKSTRAASATFAMALYTLRAVVNSDWNGVVYADALSHIPLECVPCTVR